jgi:hypothetical protein
MKPKPSETARAIVKYAGTESPTWDLARAHLRLREAAQDVAKVTSGAAVKRLRDVLKERDDE